MHLLERLAIDGHDDRHARDARDRSVSPTASESMLKPRRGEQPRHASKRPRLVLDEDRKRVCAHGYAPIPPKA